MKFTDIKQDTPRLVVMYRQDEDNSEMFQWGMVGSIPMLTLVGRIIRVQGELSLLDRYCEIDNRRDCPESALVIAWDEQRRDFDWFVHPDIPADSLVGMLDTIRTTIVHSHMARQVVAQQVQLLGPDGQPMRR